MKGIGMLALVVCTTVPRGDVAIAQDDGFAVPTGWQASPGNDTAAGEPGYRIVHPDSGIELVWVPGGTFRMGSATGQPDERPIHEVELRGFWIGLTEVTVGQWQRVMGDVPFPETNSKGDDHPLVLVTWDEASEFCWKLGLRLPTEAEWEYAAAGPEGNVYPWGNRWDAEALQWRSNRHGQEDTAPVGSLPQGASWCGALDMAGNVWEWCADWYDEAYYATSPRRGPTGPPEDLGAAVGMPDGTKKWWTGRHVIRGGSFANDDQTYFRCTMRSNDPAAAHFALGFRVSRSP